MSLIKRQYGNSLPLMAIGYRQTAGPIRSFAELVVYLATGPAFGLAYQRRHGLLAILLVVFSGCIEIVQLFVPGRHARLSDFIVDAMAMYVGVMTASLVGRIRNRRRNRKRDDSKIGSGWGADS